MVSRANLIVTCQNAFPIVRVQICMLALVSEFAVFAGWQHDQNCSSSAARFEGDSQHKRQNWNKETLKLNWGSRCYNLKSALEIGMKDEMRKMDIRLSSWTQEKLEKTGLGIFDLQATYKGIWYEHILLHLELKDKKVLPFHRFTKGDVVYLTERHHTIQVKEGAVVDVSSKWLKVTVVRNAHKNFQDEDFPFFASDLSDSDAGERLKSCIFRLDMVTNTTTYERCITAIEGFSLNLIDNHRRESFRNILKGVFPKGSSIMDEACQSPSWAQTAGSYEQLKNATSEAKEKVKNLNSSQIEAIEAGLQSTVTMWEGPPGTGKTRTLCAFVAAAVKCIPEGSKVLVTAASNAAVDNVALGLKKLRIDTIRWGQPVRMHEDVREMTLAARVLETALGKEAAKLREKFEKSKEGMDHATWKKVEAHEEAARAEIMNKVLVVACTCVTAGDPGLVGKKFVVAVLDEANQSTEPESLVALHQKVESAVIVGDSRQLDPTAANLECINLGLYYGMHERLQSLGIKPFLLNTQYRMHPFIADFPLRRFYNGEIANGVAADDRPPIKGVPWLNSQKPVLFINEDGKDIGSMQGDKGKSYTNPSQSKIALKLAESILKADTSLLPVDIGIMASYPSQAQYIRHDLSKIGGELAGVVVASVEGFQGREKEVIIFSTVRSNETCAIGFVANPRRMNVSLTRAKRGLIVIGNKRTLSTRNPWKSWFAWVKKHGLEAQK